MDKQNEINLKDMTDVEFEKKLRTAVIAKELNDFFEETPIELTYNHDNGEVDIIKEEQALKVLDDITKQAIIPFVAEVLVGLGYRKIDENVVVLTREEFEKHKGFSREEVDEISETAIKNASKETAEKFATMAKKRFEKAKNAYKGASQAVIYHDKMMFHKGEERAMEKAIQFIDEICKEIMEDKNGETLHRD